MTQVREKRILDLRWGYPFVYHKSTLVELRYSLAPDGGDVPPSCPAQFTPTESAPSAHSTEHRAGPRTGLDPFSSCPASNQTTMPHLSNLWHSLYFLSPTSHLTKSFTWLKVITRKWQFKCIHKNDNPGMIIHTYDLKRERQWHIATLNTNKEPDHQL